MKKQFVKSMLIALTIAGCHPVPASASPLKGEMREMALELCSKSVASNDLMLECIELVSGDYYDAAMQGGKAVLDKRLPSDNEIVAITREHLDCDVASPICQQTQYNYMTWFKYGAMSIIEKDSAFKSEVKAYYAD